MTSLYLGALILLGALVSACSASAPAASASDPTIQVVEVLAGGRICYVALKDNAVAAGDDIELLWCQ